MREVKNIPLILENLLKSPESDNLKGLTTDELLTILKLIIEELEKSSAVQYLGENFKDTVIVGDIHGEINTLSKLIPNFIEGKIQSIIFLGDYVDRGTHSLEVLLSVYALKLAFPDYICLLRGNHEDINANKRYGFHDDITTKFGENGNTIMDQIDVSFNFLSLMAVTPNNSLCVHGGISEKIDDLKEFNKITKPYFTLMQKEDPGDILDAMSAIIKSELDKNSIAETSSEKQDVSSPSSGAPNLGEASTHDLALTPSEGSRGPGYLKGVTPSENTQVGDTLAGLKKTPPREKQKSDDENYLYAAHYEVLWNDPREGLRGFDKSRRGRKMFYFGENMVNKFLEKNHLKRIIRSHEYSRGPFQQVFDRLLHIFSSGPYKESHEKALILHETELQTDIVDLDQFVVFKNI